MEERNKNKVEKGSIQEILIKFVAHRFITSLLISLVDIPDSMSSMIYLQMEDPAGQTGHTESTGQTAQTDFFCYGQEVACARNGNCQLTRSSKGVPLLTLDI